MELHGSQGHPVVEGMFLQELAAENNPIDECVLRELTDEEKAAGFQQQNVIGFEVVFIHIDSRVRGTANQHGVHTAFDFAGIPAVLVHQFAAGVANHVIAVRTIDNRYLVLFH